MTKLRLIAFALLLAPVLAVASEAQEMPSAQIDLGDKASLQRGASLFMSYCSGCHSLKYQRYSRIAADLDLSEDEVKQNLIYGDAKVGETITNAMPADKAGAWFGKAPPDLSVVARTKEQGGDWIYNYLKSFYVDEARPLGWNNTVFPGASMPHVLWELQGIQHAVTEPKKKNAAGEEEGCEHGEYQGQCITGFQIPDAQKGRLSPEEYDKVARDISAFLVYTGEPAALKRESLGVWVVLFLAFFTFLTYLLKAENWRDVH